MLDEYYIEELVKKKFPSKSSLIPLSVGDDCAIVNTKSTKLAVSCDSQVEGIHFNQKFMSPQEIGFRSVSIAISDLAAMGAEPKFFLNSLFIPRNTSKSFIDNLFKGFKKACNFYKIHLIGGNVTQSKSLIIDVNVFGNVVNNKIKERLKCNVGDFIYVSGNIGDASLGLEILKNKSRLDIKNKKLIKKYKTPIAKVNLGLFLGQLNYVTSMIDITDGLTLDLIRLIGKKSGKGANLNWDDIPKSDFILNSINPSKFTKKVMNGGDDYELMFTLKENRAKSFESLCRKKGFDVYRIGFIDSSGKLSLNKGGSALKLRPNGFIHKF